MAVSVLARAGGLFSRARAAFLYYHAPYDMSIWGKLRTPPSVMLMVAASWPSWSMRAGFFATLFAMLLLDEPDEYQLMQFILALKGSQGITGIILALEGFVLFVGCAVLSTPPVCDVYGPGVGLGVGAQATYQLILQALAWGAFGLLPYASQLGEVTLLGRQARRHELDRWTRERRARREATTTDGAAARRQDARPAPRKGAPTAPDEERATSYAQLHDEDEEVKEEEEDDDEDDEEDDDERADSHAAGGWCANLSARANYSNNRILHLMAWDVLAFTGAMGLFAGLLVALATQRAGEAANATDADQAANGEERAVSLGAVLHTEAFWSDWRVEVAFFLCRMLYALSALPFLLFHVPLLRTLLSHTFATGYTPAGRCVPVDATGVSAFGRWLNATLPRTDVQGQLAAEEKAALAAILAEARATGHPATAVNKAAGARKLRQLEERLTTLITPSHPLYSSFFPERAICLEYARVQAEARRVKRAARRAAPGGGEGGQAGDGTAAGGGPARSWEEEMGAMYGVEWQANADTSECTLCAQPFTLWRRRHHCRSCGRLCCDRCSRTRLVPPRGASNLKRACDRCKEAREEGGDDQGQAVAPAETSAPQGQAVAPAETSAPAATEREAVVQGDGGL